jgi:hypothetical protein
VAVVSAARPERTLKPPGAALVQASEQPAGPRGTRSALPRQADRRVGPRERLALLKARPVRTSTLLPAVASKSSLQELSSTRPNRRHQFPPGNLLAALQVGIRLAHVQLVHLPATDFVGWTASAMTQGRSSGPHDFTALAGLHFPVGQRVPAQL